jgi:hypothetical protein
LNNDLSSITGFANLIYAGGYFSVDNNNVLANCSGFARLVDATDDGEPGPGPAFEGAPDVALQVTFVGNRVGCNSIQQVLDTANGSTYCPTESDITLNSQLSVDEFQETYGLGTACNTVYGNLTVSGPGIENLNGLAGLLKVNGIFRLANNPSLTDLSGLASFKFAGDHFTIGGNDLLTSLGALSALTHVEGEFSIGGNLLLESLNGLSSLIWVGDTLSIWNNNSLTDLYGMTSLIEISGSLEIAENAVLPDTEGLGTLEFVRENLVIGRNPSLLSIGGLESLSEVVGELDVLRNDALLQINGPESLEYVGRVRIRDNIALEQISGFDGLAALGGTLSGIHITSNASLSRLEGFSSLVEIPGLISLEYNSDLRTARFLGSLQAVGNFIHITGNSSLQSLEFFSRLERVDQNLEIRFSNQLEALTGLASLEFLGGSLDISANSTLEDCSDLQRLLDGIDDGLPGPGSDPVPDVRGTVSLGSNAPGCNSIQEILASANPDPAISVSLNPEPLILVASEPGAPTPSGTATITNTGDPETLLTGNCSLTGADTQISLINGAFSVAQGAAGHVVTIGCDASVAGHFTATLSCSHNGTNVSSPRNYPVSCTVNDSTGPQVPCSGCTERTQRPWPASGPWADPEQDGSGFLFRIQDGTLGGFYFGYGDAGDSDWLLMNGVLEPGDTSEVLWQLETHLSRFTGGSCPGCDYAAPGGIEQTDMIRVEFLQKNHARYRINGGVWHYLVPVLYGTAGYAHFPESTPYLFPELGGEDEDANAWVLVFEEPFEVGAAIVDTTIVHLGPSETAIDPDRGLLVEYISEERFSLADPQPPVATVRCGNVGLSLSLQCGVHISFHNYVNTFYMPIANLGANRFFAEDEAGNSIEAFRIGYD